MGSEIETRHASMLKTRIPDKPHRCHTSMLLAGIQAFLDVKKTCGWHDNVPISTLSMIQNFLSGIRVVKIID